MTPKANVGLPEGERRNGYNMTADHQGAADTVRPVLTCLADIEPQSVEWLWPGRVPAGRLTLLVGRPGEGKSLLTLDMAARVTNGTPWPDGSVCPIGSVILITGEDDPADTIRPRLDAAHADASKVYLLSGVRRIKDDDDSKDRGFTLGDVGALELAMRDHRDCRLVIIDPIGSFIGGRVDAHRDNEVRSVLDPVAALAQQYGPAVLVVAHRRKGVVDFADDLAIGSRAFTATARVVWHLTRDTDNRARRLLLPGKNNLAPENEGLAFVISGDPPRICWDQQPVKMTADDGLAREYAAHRLGSRSKAREAAVPWLKDLLTAGPMPAERVKDEARRAGHAWRTVHRAAEDLGVSRVKNGFDEGWVWKLPDAANGRGHPKMPSSTWQVGKLAPSQESAENEGNEGSGARRCQVRQSGIFECRYAANGEIVDNPTNRAGEDPDAPPAWDDSEIPVEDAEMVSPW